VAPTAIEEIVRWASPLIFMRRTATCDTEIGGQKVREGDKLLLFYCSGNRDEAIFTDPTDSTFAATEHAPRLRRGPHFCLAPTSHGARSR